MLFQPWIDHFAKFSNVLLVYLLWYCFWFLISVLGKDGTYQPLVWFWFCLFTIIRIAEFWFAINNGFLLLQLWYQFNNDDNPWFLLLLYVNFSSRIYCDVLYEVLIVMTRDQIAYRLSGGFQNSHLWSSFNSGGSRWLLTCCRICSGIFMHALLQVFSFLYVYQRQRYQNLVQICSQLWFQVGYNFWFLISFGFFILWFQTWSFSLWCLWNCWMVACIIWLTYNLISKVWFTMDRGQLALLWKLGVFVQLLFIFGYGFRLILGYAYPPYECFKSIEKHGTRNAEL